MVKRKQPHDQLRVIIAGGGTGGHVFPAIAIAKAIKKKVYNARILFVGAKGKLEMRKVPEAGFHIIGLNIAGVQRRLTLKNFLVPFKLCDSMFRAKNIVKRFKPNVVIGVGGYASGPVVKAASAQGVPTLIQEQNSYPGITNRVLGRKANKICVAYEGMERYFDKSRLYLTGNPVRQDIVNLEGKKQEALAFFGLSPHRSVLLVTGGSLGALTINRSLTAHAGKLASEEIQVIWQTGNGYYEQALEAVRGFKEYFSIHRFIDRMDLAYAAADLIVSRAGAIAVSEICATQKPAILIPSPNVAEDHQTKNAMALGNHQAAVLIKDSEAIERLGQEVTSLIKDADKLFRIKEKLAGLALRDSADVIAAEALSLVKT